MSKVADWFLENSDVWLHPSVKIDKSALEDAASGYGVFVDLSQDEILNNHKNEIDLMRIPRRDTFDVHTVFQILNDEKQYSSKQVRERTERKFKEVFTEMLEQEGMVDLLNESNTLIAFFLVCIMLGHEFEVPSILAYYLNNVLLKTITGNGANYVESLAEFYSDNVESHLLKKTLDKFELFASGVPRDTVRQLFAAIRSRCLEIPQELDQSSDDFVVNSTLVPLLDLCNHSNSPNAYYDVDRQTGDVILRLDLESCSPSQEDKWLEVFISYSPSLEIFSFHNSYGFIPPNDNFQFFNISIQRDFLSQWKVGNGNLRLFYKWFKINPVVQLIGLKGKWYINDTSEEFALLLLPFLSSTQDSNKSCWHYDHRKHETFAHFYRYVNQNNSVNFPQSRKFYKYELNRQERGFCDVITFPQLAWCLHYENNGKLLRKRTEQMEALELAPFDDPRQFELVIEAFKGFFISYLDHRESAIVKHEGEKSRRNTSFNQLLQIEISILRELKDGLRRNQLKFWSDLDIDAPEIVPRLPLFWKPNTQQWIENTQDPEVNSLEDLSIASYDPHELTDFYDEELSNFLSLTTRD